MNKYYFDIVLGHRSSESIKLPTDNCINRCMCKAKQALDALDRILKSVDDVVLLEVLESPQDLSGCVK